MRIKEVEDLTGLTRKAIRYYEENGLIQTVKGANGYKEYDEETVKCLLEIKKLRLLDFSVSDIAAYQNDRNWEQIVKEKIEETEDAIKTAGRRKKLLEQVQKGKALSELDVEQELWKKKMGIQEILMKNSVFGICNLILFGIVHIWLIGEWNQMKEIELSNTILFGQCMLTAFFCIWNAHLEKESRKRGIFLRQQKWYEKALMLILFTLTYIVAGQMELCWIGVLGVRITQIQQEKGQFFMAMGEFLWEVPRMLFIIGMFGIEILLLILGFFACGKKAGEFLIDR